MHEILVNPLGGLSLPRKSVVRLTNRSDMTLDVYRGRKTTMQQQQQQSMLRNICGNETILTQKESKIKIVEVLSSMGPESLLIMSHPNWIYTVCSLFFEFSIKYSIIYQTGFECVTHFVIFHLNP